MGFGLSSIRRKLTVLVLLPVVMTLGALATLERVLEGQLLGEVERRVLASQSAVQTRLDEDLQALKLELLGLASKVQLLGDLDVGDGAAVAAIAAELAAGYPGVAVLVATLDGRVLSAEGFGRVATLDDVDGLQVPRPGALVTKTLSMVGCSGRDEVPARLLATRAGSSGIVVACQPLSRTFLERTAAQLGLGLAVIDLQREHRVLAHTPDFPVRALPRRGESVLHEEGEALWAVAHFCPSLLPAAPTPCTLDVLSAMSVAELRHTLRADFVWTSGALVVAGLLALVWGGRMALTMTRALERLVGGFGRLKLQNYQALEPMRTGDEIEQLVEGFNDAVQGLREHERLRTTFGKYMTESVMSHLLANRVQLGGDTVAVTILFSDIRGFTTLSERLDAQELVALLNEYFTEMVDIVMDHGGVVDKYIGDAIMVVFGAPVPRQDDALRAVQAATKMRAALAQLNERLSSRGLSPIQTGIGIHSGEVVAGNIGSERRMEYTVIGDAVNVASRLEGCTKQLGADLVISEATHALVRDHVEAVQLGTISVKGRAQPIEVFEVKAVHAGI